MATKIEGLITYKGEKKPELPDGCVAFVYLMQDQKVLGHQAISKIYEFPFEYNIDLDEKVLAGKDCSIRVTIESGESILFVNPGVKIEKGSLPEKLNIELAEFSMA